ncbi:hypothetical protein [Alloactinosynnema sp. L-07]|uniref:hypothetical protein n=1 Tax=Alloactinosynnema sp. L-07 TaxID=1653480 RepID=UPI00065EF7EC|nr:hypothetical protein [Alloactinosynnema sp. L-07]CRK56819.1 hypothetical protein [Alloactinosynnema sp. L-07]
MQPWREVELMGTDSILVSTEPGLVALRASGEAVDDETARALFDDFIDSSSVAGTALARELAALVAAHGDDRGLVDDFWQYLYELFEPRWHVKVREEVVLVDVAAYYLLPAPAPGCTVSLTVSHARERDANATLKLAGIGGGGTTTLKLTDSYERKAAGVAEVFAVSVPVVIEEMEVRSGPGKGTRYLRTGDAGPPGVHGVASRSFTAPPVPPGVAELRTVDLTTSSTGSFSTSHDAAAGTAWEASIGLDLKSIGLEAELGYKGSYESTIKLDYELKVGRRYRSFAVASVPVPVWTVDP